MNQEEINSLLRKVLTQQASQEEVQQLQDWRSASPKNERMFNVMQQVWQERSLDPVMAHPEKHSQRIWDQAHPASQEGHPRKFFTLYVKAKIAAAIAFLFIFGGVVFWINHQSKPVAVQVGMVQKINPAGQKSKLFLPDGSIVWLNAESTLTYPARFSDTIRLVKLEGEAYFEVAKNARKPFTVQSGKVHTTAVGTSFDISAYAEDDRLTVALITGKVKIEQEGQQESVMLEAGKGFQLESGNQQHHIFQIQENEVLAWNHGILTFDGDNFEQAVKKIQRWYGVAVILKGMPPSDWQLTGHFENEYLTHVMETIEFGRNFQFELDDNTLTLIFN